MGDSSMAEFAPADVYVSTGNEKPPQTPQKVARWWIKNHPDIAAAYGITEDNPWGTNGEWEYPNTY